MLFLTKNTQFTKKTRFLCARTQVTTHDWTSHKNEPNNDNINSISNTKWDASLHSPNDEKQLEGLYSALFLLHNLTCISYPLSFFRLQETTPQKAGLLRFLRSWVVFPLSYKTWFSHLFYLFPMICKHFLRFTAVKRTVTKHPSTPSHWSSAW